MLRCFSVIIFTFFLSVQTGQAQTYTWDGGGSDGNWSTSENWVDDIPISDAGSFKPLIFSGTSNLNSINNITAGAGGFNVVDITFAADAGAFTLSGNSFDMLGENVNTDTADITNLSSNLQTISLNLIGRADFTTALVFDTAAGDIRVTGIISGSGANVTKTGSHTLTLEANNSYSGVTTINEGVLEAMVLANGGISSSIGLATSDAANLVFNGGTLRYTGATAVGTNRSFTLGAQGGTIETITGSGIRMDGVAIGDGPLTIGGAGYVAFVNEASTFTGVATVNAGATLEIRNAAVLGEEDADSNTVVHGTLQINPTGGNGAGTNLTINEFITLEEGGRILNSSRSNTLASDVTLNGEASFDVAGGSSLIIGSGKLMGTGGFEKIGDGTLQLSGANSFSGGVTLSEGTLSVNSLADTGIASPLGTSATDIILNGGRFLYTGGAAGTIRGFTITANGGTLSTNSASSPFRIGGKITGSGSLLVNGSGYIAFSSNTNDYTGRTTIAAGSAIYMRTSNALGAIGSSSDTIVDGSLVFDAGGSSGVNANLNVMETVTFNAGSTMRSLNYDNTFAGDVTFASGTVNANVADGSSISVTSDITGDGGFTLNNVNGTLKDGLVVFTGANVYSGPTTVVNGVLQVGRASTGSLLSETTVQLAGRLSGTGVINNLTTIQGMLSAGDNGGDSVGMLTLQQLALEDGATLLFQLQGADTVLGDMSELASLLDPTQSGANDFVNVLDVISSAPGEVVNLQLDFSGASVVAGGVYDLFDADTFDLQSTFNITVVGGDLNGYGIDTSRLADLGVIAITPEPSRALFLTLGAFAFMYRRRRSA